MGASTIYPKQSPTSANEGNLALLNANEASKDNPLLTEEDLNKDGVAMVIFIAPNGTKWKKTVDNTGAFVTVQV